MRPQAVREEWAGLTVWLPNTAAVCRDATDVAFTVLDVLGYLDEIPVCVGYEIDGKVTTDFPTTPTAGESKTGITRRCRAGNAISAVSRSTRICRRTAANTLSLWKKQIGFPITMVSNGPGREDIIYRNK